MTQQITATLLLSKTVPLAAGARWIMRLDIEDLPSNEDGLPALFRIALPIVDVPAGVAVRHLLQEARPYEVEKYNRVRVVSLEIENVTLADIALDNVRVALCGFAALPREAGLAAVASEALAQSSDWSANTVDGVAVVTVAAERVASMGGGTDGGASNQSTTWSEAPSGALNSSNATFVLAQIPVFGSVRLFINGLGARPGPGNDYSINGRTLTLSEAPLSTDVLLADYSVNI